MSQNILSGKLDELVKIARNQNNKRAFVDPAMAAGGGAPPMDPAMGGAPPMDPAMGGAPPMDPAMGGAPPMDPMAGGAPPMDPGMGGGGPDLEAMITSAVQNAMGAGGGGVGGAMQGQAGPDGQIKPKIDVNVEIMQIKNMLAKIADSLGVQIPAQDMVATPDKLTAMAQGIPPAGAGGDPAGGGGGGGGIPPIEPMGGMGGGGGAKMGSYVEGEPAGSERMLHQADQAAALAAVLSKR